MWRQKVFCESLKNVCEPLKVFCESLKIGLETFKVCNANPPAKKRENNSDKLN
jgi:hypothetical protein